MSFGDRRGATPALGAALVASLACAPYPTRDPRPAALEVREVSCTSGLRVVFERVPTSRVVNVTTLVGVGSTEDPPGHEGLAHLVEHLAVRAERATGPTPRLEALGVSQNADTSFDATTFFAVGPAASAPRMLAAAAHHLARPLDGVDDAAFDVERSVVRNELRERNETRYVGQAVQWLQEAVFPPTHLYARPVGGTHESLSALTLADAHLFTDTHYRPERTTIVVTGDIEPAQANRLVADTLAGSCDGEPRREPVRPAAAPPPPEPPGTFFTRHRLDVATPELWIGWSTPGGQHRDRYLNELWTAIASANLAAGRLDDRDVARVEFFELPGEESTIVACRLELVAGLHPELTVGHVLRELPWSADDESLFWRGFVPAKLAALRDLAFEREDAAARGRSLAELAHAADTLDVFGTIAAGWKSITPDEARGFARRFLGPERARIVYIEPGGARPPAAPLAPSRASVTLSAPETLSPALVAEIARSPHLEGMRAATLSNGLTVIAVPRMSAPVVTATLGFHGGPDAGHTGLALAGIHALHVDVDDMPDEVGVDLRFWSNGGLAGITGRADAGGLDQVLALLGRVTSAYRVEWPSWTFQQQRLPLLQSQEHTAAFAADVAFANALFPRSVLGHVATAQEIGAITKAQAAAWIERTIVPRNAALVLVGGFDPDRALAAAQSALGGWRSDGDVARPPAALTPGLVTVEAPRWAQPTIVVNRPGATQAELRAGCVLPPTDSERDPRYDLAARYVEDTLGDALREATGTSYGVHAAASASEGGTAALQLGTVIGNDRLADAVDALRRFWTGARAPVVTLTLARQQAELVGERLFALESSPELEMRLITEWNLGWPRTAIDAYGLRVTETTGAEAATILRGCAERLVVVITGNESVVTAALRRASPSSPGP